jgi:hypothetical protein
MSECYWCGGPAGGREKCDCGAHNIDACPDCGEAENCPVGDEPDTAAGGVWERGR